MALNVEPPPEGPVEQDARVELSGRRSLAASMSFLAARPTLQVVYTDPHFLETAAATLPDEQESEEVSAFIPKPALETVRRLPRNRALLEWLRRSLNPGFLLKPGVITATLATILAVAVFLYTSTRSVSASQLLAEAEIAEQGVLKTPGTVIHRSIALEERNLSKGGSASRKRIEVWQTSGTEEANSRALRLYDEGGRLEAVEFTQPDGSRTLYRNGNRSAVNPPTAFPAQSEDIWRLDLSAKTFSAVVGDLTQARVDQQAAIYVISYVSRPEADRSGVLRAGLTLTKADLHAAGPEDSALSAI